MHSTCLKLVLSCAHCFSYSLPLVSCFLNSLAIQQAAWWNWTHISAKIFNCLACGALMRCCHSSTTQRLLYSVLHGNLKQVCTFAKRWFAELKCSVAVFLRRKFRCCHLYTATTRVNWSQQFLLLCAVSFCALFAECTADARPSFCFFKKPAFAVFLCVQMFVFLVIYLHFHPHVDVVLAFLLMEPACSWCVQHVTKWSLFLTMLPKHLLLLT